MRNIQTYNAPGPRRYIGINLWGLGGPPPPGYIYAPIGLNISRFCAPSTSPRFRPSVFSILPFAVLRALRRRRALLLSAIAFHVRFCLGSKLRLARYECHRVPTPNKNHYFPRRMPLPRNAPFELITHNMRFRKRDARVSKRISYGRLRNFIRLI